MRSFLFLLSVACAANLYVANTEKEAKPPQIINGNDAKTSDYPWQASLHVYYWRIGQYTHTCGGSLISDKWILTAAHCCYNDDQQLIGTDMVFVLLGTNYRNGLEFGSQQHLVDAIIPHEQYNGPRNVQNDIALWHLKGKAVIVPYLVDIIPLPRKMEYVNKRADVTITGWGVIQAANLDNGREISMCDHRIILQKIYSSKRTTKIRTICGDIIIEGHLVRLLPYRLREAQVPVVQRCKSHFICLGNQSYAACSGDSGGPMVQRVNGQWKQFGIASTAEVSMGVCLLGDGNSRYTDVNYYIDWINKVLSSRAD